MRIWLYKFTTSVYFIIGLLAAFLTVFFIFSRNLLLVIICALITYFSFNRVSSKRRKARYYGNQSRL